MPAILPSVTSEDDLSSPVYHAACAIQKSRGERDQRDFADAVKLVEKAHMVLKEAAKAAPARFKGAMEAHSKHLCSLCVDMESTESELWERLHPLSAIRAEIVAAARGGVAA